MPLGTVFAETVTYEFSLLFAEAWNVAMTAKNIQVGFKTLRIHGQRLVRENPF